MKQRGIQERIAGTRKNDSRLTVWPQPFLWDIWMACEGQRPAGSLGGLMSLGHITALDLRMSQLTLPRACLEQRHQSALCVDGSAPGLVHVPNTFPNFAFYRLTNNSPFFAATASFYAISLPSVGLRAQRSIHDQR
jgi:hypothetical protein